MVGHDIMKMFCKKHLRSKDETITLADEDGNESPTKYHTNKACLCSGWRRFAVDNELAHGDALVFQLITRTRFKVSSWTWIDDCLVHV
jgi:hypothetical protein